MSSQQCRRSVSLHAARPLRTEMGSPSTLRAGNLEREGKGMSVECRNCIGVVFVAVFVQAALRCPTAQAKLFGEGGQR